MTSGDVSDAIDHGLFNLLAAPADLDGPRLSFAIAVARWAILVAPILLLWTWFRGGPEDRRAAVTAALAGALGLGAAAVLSSIFFEPRPFMDGLASNVLDHARDSGYPSDHATVLFALAFALRLRRPPASPHIWMPALALAVAVGWARVFLGVHYPVDIVGGAYLAAVAACAVASAGGRTATEHVTGLCEAALTRSLEVIRPWLSGSDPRV